MVISLLFTLLKHICFLLIKAQQDSLRNQGLFDRVAPFSLAKELNSDIYRGFTGGDDVCSGVPAQRRGHMHICANRKLNHSSFVFITAL